MNSKIACVSDREDFFLGFELVGIQNFKKKDLEKLIDKKNNYSLIILDEKIFKSLNIKLKYFIENEINPIFIILNENSNNKSKLRSMIKKTFGIDIMKNN